MADRPMEQDLDFEVSADEFQSDKSSSSSGSSTEDSETENGAEEEWSDMDTQQSFRFTGRPAINIGFAETPMDYFKLLFTTTFMNMLVSSINLHSIQLLKDPENDFKLTDVDEVYTLLAIYFLMGHVKINQWSYYWYSHPLYNLKFEDYMCKDRFRILMRSLAFKIKSVRDDNGDSRRSWYDTAKPIADYFNCLMKSLVSPAKELNIDKYTAYWFDESNFVRKKPERIRMHLLSDNNGIFQRVYLCHPDGKSKGDVVVKSLLKDFFGIGHSLYACPFYTSIGLAEELLDKKTYLTGILKRKRPRNPSFVRKKLKIGAVKAQVNSKGVCVCNFRKSQTILGLSTEHGGTLNVHGKSMYPEMTSQFKMHTKVMFKRNRILSDNAPQDVTKKYNKTVLYLLQVMFMNAYIMYSISKNSKMSFGDFRRDILENILSLPKNHDSSGSDEDTDASEEAPYQLVDPELIHLPSKLGKRNKTKRNCRQCWLQHQTKKTTLFFCPQCPQRWGLCIECFREFHSY